MGDHLRDAAVALPRKGPVHVDPVDRRKHPRIAYPYVQRIAPWTHGERPEPDAFTYVRCKDISASGFSYYGDEPPESDSFVMALGIPPLVTYVIAKIVHVTYVEDDGPDRCVVGCKYVGRAVYI
jgi:hypothetical protein